MIRLLLSSLILINFTITACCQPPVNRPHCTNEKFDQEVSTLLSFSVPTIGVPELKGNLNDYLVLDAREKNEYNISHIPSAKYIGYDNLDTTILEGVDKDQAIVLYCSVGYRSEKIGEKLLTMGYTNVMNLYGSIFEWANQENEMVDKNNQPTKKVHTYNKKWSKWVDKSVAKKVY